MAKRKLGIFLISAVLASLIYHVASQALWEHIGNNIFFYPAYRRVTFGYLNAFLFPALIIGAVAWRMGFYRRGSENRAPLAATLILVVVVIVTAGAPWPCWFGCV